MKRVAITIKDIPLGPTRNAMIGLQRNSPHQANAVKQKYQEAVRKVIREQLPDWWQNPIDFSVCVVFDVRFGPIANLAGKKGSTTDPSRCDADNALSVKMLLDAMTLDKRKRLMGKLTGSTFRTNKKLKVDDLPVNLYNTEGDPVPVLNVVPVDPVYGAKGGILKRPYHLDLTVKADKIEDKRLWLPEPDQSHAILADDNRSIIPNTPLVLHSELKSDNPGVDVHIFGMGDIDHKEWRDVVLSFVESI